jgi:peptidyl-prolyl cis-trans isomerase B (cyclophilin B)
VAYQPGNVAPTNTLAIIALILGFVVPLAGIICGHIALGQIKRTGEGGHGLALAGTIIGYVFTGLGILFVIIYAVFFVALFSSGALYPGTVI